MVICNFSFFIIGFFIANKTYNIKNYYITRKAYTKIETWVVVDYFNKDFKKATT